MTTFDVTKKHSRGDRATEPLIFEKQVDDVVGVDLPPLDVPETKIPTIMQGGSKTLPTFGQHDVMAHYTHLSDRNFSVDGNFYPLGSCTMKHNPRINEWGASLPGFACLHPLQDDDTIQGALRLLYETRTMLEEISGMHEVSLQPAAGAHGEFTALKVIRAYFADHGQPERTVVLAADTAHGTNPASCTMCGASVQTVRTSNGQTDLDHLQEVIADVGAENIAAFMITNPSTAGLFDSNIKKIADIVHSAGAKLYLDGANMNAMLGRVRPGDFGADAMHYNTHKTFSTPHGGGGPGSGPIAVTEELAPYLPVPQVMMADDGSFYLDRDREKSIGKVRSFICQFGVLVRCWAYISACGPNGLRNVSETAVLNANYIAAKLRERYAMPFFDPQNGNYCAHEFVTVPQQLLDKGVTLIDIAKRMIDYGVHPPTMHWPIHDCFMVEPTETESKAALDSFIDVMLQIADEIDSDIELVLQSPQESDIARADEVSAARKPIIAYPK
ncbi:MAG: aminomethyl-transferring glycine dehydrogenase subunit GcvPB [Phycisphaerales bacterium]|nr:aminomethyl-transferring glycine dehydrogenase subunit GcvPB [Planctomycetota bacterium]MBL6997155.1 aminomethyl-transferring glycine dehydrogenase subunit GcvPB [Phycisphaerales bacterium]